MPRTGSSTNPQTTFAKTREAAQRTAERTAQTVQGRNQGLPRTATVNAEKSRAARDSAMQRFNASNQARHGG